MALADWGFISEIVSALTVVATLVYLAKEVKHASDVSKVASYHQAIDQIVQAATAPDFAELMVKTERGEALTEIEERRAFALAVCVLYGHEILLHLQQTGQVDERLWRNIFENDLTFLESTMIASVLRERGGRISCDLRAAIERRRAERDSRNEA